MPNNIQKLLPGSFRGVECFVYAEKKGSLGRKTAIHDYPNSGKRFVQDLGPKVPEFDISLYVFGNNYSGKAQNLEKVLTEEGHGRLVLPNEGAVNVKVIDYTVNYDYTRIGIIGFDVKFSVSNADEDAAIAPASIEDVFQAGDEARLSMQEKFVENYEVPKSRFNLLKAAEDFVYAINNTIDKYSRTTVFDNSRLKNLLFDVQNTITRLVRLPDELSKKLIYGNLNALDGLFSTIASLFTDPDNDSSSKPSGDIALSASNFGDDLKDNGTAPSVSDIPLWPEDTANRKVRNKNRIITVESVRLNALVLGFETAANFDYQTSEEINEIIIQLEEAYAALITIGDPQTIFAADDEIKELIDNVKNAAYEVLDQKAQQVFTVTDLEFKGLNSATGLSYKLYKEQLESSSELEEISELINNLNPTINPLLMTGTIKAFES